MKRLATAALAAVLALLAACRDDALLPADPRPSARLVLPPPEAAVPVTSPRNASYSIDARLFPDDHRLEGTLVLEWRNTTGQPQSTLPFHLYWNAFRNTLSTSARGVGRRAAKADDDRAFGFAHVSAVKLQGDGSEVDLTPTLRHVAPDDGNADDRTVMEVTTPAPIPPDATARIHITWTSRIPHGATGRSGWVHDYHFIAQWFPKIGVFWKGAWNAHQFHPTTEFFADYGTYDVRLTLPTGFVVGATGALVERTANGDGTETFRFREEDVHDFAWTASRRFLERSGRFEEPGYPPVDIRLLLQPEHEELADRYIEATRVGLKAYGAWSLPYPWRQITVVDPAWASGSGGMEYPTLITGGTGLWAPLPLHSPETVTVHETGHQFWYLLVGTNEFEEAWLDEGFNRYHDRKSMFGAYGPKGFGVRYFGLSGRSNSGWPVLAPRVAIPRGEDLRALLRETGQVDVMTRRAWEYRTPGAYSFNAYTKPALTLQTLENLVGDETMTRILRTYARRHVFAHPTTEDFIAVVNEVTGADWRWYFDETWFSSGLCDYAVEVANTPPPRPAGFLDGPSGPVPAPSPAPADEDLAEPVVTVIRLGEVRLPVEVEVEFADGRTVRETWDGQYRWTRFRYPRGPKVVRASVDPDHRILLDVQPSNNAWVEDRGQARRAARKWAARWMLWVQAFLEMHTVIG